MSNRWMKLYYLCFVLVGLVNHPFASALSSEEAFIEKYSVDKEIAEILDRNVSVFIQELSLCNTDCCTNRKRFLKWKFDELPNYILKFRIDRIIGREKIDQCIKDNDLTCLTVPGKWLYHIKGRGAELTNYNYLVVAEKHEGRRARNFTFEEVRQICVLLKDTGYFDFALLNALRLEDGRISFIDTEYRDFDKDEPWGGLVQIFKENAGFDLNADFSEESIRYIFQELLENMPRDYRRYKKIYNRMLDLLKNHPKPTSWDSVSYFKKLFPDPEVRFDRC